MQSWKSRNGAPAASARRPGKPVSFVFLPTLACNCACEHCFESQDGTTIRRQDWAPIFGAMRDIAVRQESRWVRIYWQGGEVLCLPPADVGWGLDRAAEAFDGTGIRVEHHLQSNLLLYDRRHWRDVIRRFDAACLGTSLDYPNPYRRMRDGAAASYERDWLEKKRIAEEDGFRLGVITLPNAESLRLGPDRFHRYFAEVIRPARLQINLPFRLSGDFPESLDLPALGDFLIGLYEAWVSGGRRFPLSPFLGLEERLADGSGVLPCIWGANCADGFLAIGPAGEAAQCDCWLTGDPAYRFGSVLTDGVDAVLASPGRRRFLERPLRLVRNTSCGECRFWGLCHGGCPVRAYAASGTLLAADPYCPVYDRVFRRVLEEAAKPQAPGPDHGS